MALVILIVVVIVPTIKIVQPADDGKLAVVRIRKKHNLHLLIRKFY